MKAGVDGGISGKVLSRYGREDARVVVGQTD